MSRVILALAFLCVIASVQADFFPAQTFSGDFTLFTNYSITVGGSGSSNPPIVYSPALYPIAGKFQVDYPKFGFAAAVTAGQGSPWTLDMSVSIEAVSVKKNSDGSNNVTAAYSVFAGDNCWYANLEVDNLPTIFGQNQNSTLLGTVNVDGSSCLLFNTTYGDLVAVRIHDLAIMRVTFPNFYAQGVPFFPIIGEGNAETQLSFQNVKTSIPDPITAPKNCIKVDLNDLPIPNYENFGDEHPLMTLIKRSPLTAMFQRSKSNEKQSLDFDTTIDALRAKYADSTETGANDRTIAQSVSAKFTMWENSTKIGPKVPYGLAGHINYDFSQSGFRVSVDETLGAFPFDFSVGLGMAPDVNGVEFLQVGNGNCYSYLYLQWIFVQLIPRFEVPESAVFVGSQTIHGEACDVWVTPSWFWNQEVALAMYIRQSDRAFVQLITVGSSGSQDGTAFIKLTDIKLSAPPASYGNPGTCDNLMSWSHDFDSHLEWGWCYPFC
eukprot:TRINITY_DN4172_c0_g1_i1.p1 TRINITY_DN4172_c0_g1~~TRINITY_DN4172_c0_g1_i1.p1  ORF type:complete len:504 (+),score=145.11 TRINITY_DN4172_c0_g1_i1:34-1512(+)